MLDPAFLKAKFASALQYDDYLATGTPDQQERWRDYDHTARAHASLNSHQRTVVRDFTRCVNVLVISGMWCGDCVAQCPLLAAIADENSELIRVRFLDRDKNLDIAEQVKICGGLRVPTVIFMNEDFEFMALGGDKSLARLRAIAATALGAMCPIPGAEVPPDEIRATLADWLAEVERVHLLCRLSSKLRDRHGD